MTGPSDLSSRVRAAIEETMRIAQKVPPDFRQSQWSDPGPWIMSGTSLSMHDEVARVADHVPMPIAEAIAEHIAFQNPRETLRRCEADLRTLDRYDFAANKLREMQAEQEKANVVAAMATVILKAVHDALYAVLCDRASAYGVPVDPEGS